MNADATRRTTIIPMCQGVDQGFSNCSFWIERRILSLGITFDESRNRGQEEKINCKFLCQTTSSEHAATMPRLSRHHVCHCTNVRSWTLSDRNNSTSSPGMISKAYSRPSSVIASLTGRNSPKESFATNNRTKNYSRKIVAFNFRHFSRGR